MIANAEKLPTSRRSGGSCPTYKGCGACRFFVDLEIEVEQVCLSCASERHDAGCLHDVNRASGSLPPFDAFLLKPGFQTLAQPGRILCHLVGWQMLRRVRRWMTLEARRVQAAAKYSVQQEACQRRTAVGRSYLSDPSLGHEVEKPLAVQPEIPNLRALRLGE